ncbi:hypothetical protein [Pseudomonas psychrophila]|uniref:hypothetical protein n=1 Tax=Pseudomonas psychrophila TaxID=122355 RepID=UPI000357D977|nr:hypothetical protein [Pseudomonas psychrophila]EPJ92148.1 hypothetical protein CF149_19326 [Pseudomonas psychrophila]
MASSLNSCTSLISKDIGDEAIFYEFYQEQVAQDETQPAPQFFEMKKSTGTPTVKDDTKEIPLYELMLKFEKLLKMPQPVSIATVKRNHALMESIRHLKETAEVYEKYWPELNDG